MESSAETGSNGESPLCHHGRTRFLDARLRGKDRGLTKPYPVVCHLVDTGAYFAELWELTVGPSLRARVALELGLSEPDAARELAFWAALHDLGKISPSYQHFLSTEACKDYPEYFEQLLADGRYRHGRGGTNNRTAPHDRITHWALPGIFEQLGYSADAPGGQARDLIGHAVGQLLGGHHGSFYPRMERRQLRSPATFLPQLGLGAWPEQRLGHARMVRTLITDDGPVPTGMLPVELAVVVLGVVMVADWMASDTKSIESVRCLADEACCCDEALRQHWERVRETARERVGKQALGRCGFAASPEEELLRAAGFPDGSVHGRLARRLLTEAGPAQGGMLLVSAPTGPARRRLGMVAASKLGRASKARGIALALPDEMHLDDASKELASLAGTLLEGSGELVRLHTMSFDVGPETAFEDIPELSLAPEDQAVAKKWLTQQRRGLLAPLGVGALDQFLLAVLPVPDNAVRLFGLSEKVFVVDDVRPQEPALHQLLCSLVEWLAALGTSVVLLTDTLAGESADRLVTAYRRGAQVARGPKTRENGASPSAELPRPGWLYVDGRDGSVTAVADDAPEDSVLPVSLLEARSRPGGADPYVDAVTDRSGGTGSTLVCCDSVEEAQRTFIAIEQHRRLHATPGEVRLLHQRFRRHHFRELMEECAAAHKNAAQDGSVLVTTPAFAEYLPFRFERVVTRSAPLPSLLARASHGRCLTILEGGEQTGSPMDRALRQHTVQALRSHGPQLRLPDDAARLIRQVYDSDSYLAAFEDIRARRKGHLLAAAAEGHEAWLLHEARRAGIRGPADVHGDLYELTRTERGLTKERLAATMGIEEAYVLFIHLRGEVPFLDPEGKEEVPRLKEGGGSAVAALARHAIPVPPQWAPAGGLSEQMGRERFPRLKNLNYTYWIKRTWLNQVYPVVLGADGDPDTGLLGAMRVGYTRTGLFRHG
ncbi:CRISPR-associated endonuclease Cas3'' [Streptomyces sp. NPDC015144]|uniref:CRISPR-associated endonuclease Cas3'' n=1 Tax=Streptomyces sp. NPDC015144 TaxID=3364944 RepID=UPI0036F4FB84